MNGKLPGKWRSKGDRYPKIVTSQTNISSSLEAVRTIFVKCDRYFFHVKKSLFSVFAWHPHDFWICLDIFPWHPHRIPMLKPSTTRSLGSKVCPPCCEMPRRRGRSSWRSWSCCGNTPSSWNPSCAQMGCMEDGKIWEDMGRWIYYLIYIYIYLKINESCSQKLFLWFWSCWFEFMSGFQLGREDSEGPKTGWAKRSPAETLKHGRRNLVPYPIWEGFPWVEVIMIQDNPKWWNRNDETDLNRLKQTWFTSDVSPFLTISHHFFHEFMVDPLRMRRMPSWLRRNCRGFGFFGRDGQKWRWPRVLIVFFPLNVLYIYII